MTYCVDLNLNYKFIVISTSHGPGHATSTMLARQ
jgi:hypothetical protein